MYLIHIIYTYMYIYTQVSYMVYTYVDACARRDVGLHGPTILSTRHTDADGVIPCMTLSPLRPSIAGGFMYPVGASARLCPSMAMGSCQH